MSWVISVTSSKLDRQSPWLSLNGRGMNGGAWRFHAHDPRRQGQVLAELCAPNDPAKPQDKQ
ncbi:hypothetical protein GCM10007386_57230 [Pseudoduganella dura]|nr:hypothetical protein GCM10007386_57230 [Pseudoduganella dura]